jgi:hypothetical protein
MAEIKTESQGTSQEPATVAPIEYLPDYGEILESLFPQDVSPLEAALKASEIAVEVAMKGSAVEYMKASKARDEAKQSLHNATALTQDESLAISLNGHKMLISLHEVVSDFDAAHGISYATKTKSKGARKGTGTISQAEWDSIPSQDKKDYSMSFNGDAITLTGDATGDVHTCRTMATLERHKAN